MSGDLVEGGSFRMAVHRHDRRRADDAGLRLDLGAGRAGEAAIAFRWDAGAPGGSPLAHRADRRRRSPAGRSRGPAVGRASRASAMHRRVTDEFWEHPRARALRRADAGQRAERATLVGQGSDDYVGPAGEEMAAILHAQPELVDQVNAWCDRLGLGYRVRMLDPVSPDLVMTAGRLRGPGAGGRPPRPAGPGVLAGRRLRHRPAAADHRAVAAGTRTALILVEQPEVHLHPRLQAAVGRPVRRHRAVRAGRSCWSRRTPSTWCCGCCAASARGAGPARPGHPLRRPRRLGRGVRAPPRGGRRRRPRRRLAGRLLRRAAGRRAARRWRGLMTGNGRAAAARSVFGVGDLRRPRSADRASDPALRRADPRGPARGPLRARPAGLHLPGSTWTCSWPPCARCRPRWPRPGRWCCPAGGCRCGIARPAAGRSRSATSSTPRLIDAELADDLELVLVEADQAELLGVADDEFSAITPSGLVEIGRITTAGRTAVAAGRPRGRWTPRCARG